MPDVANPKHDLPEDIKSAVDLVQAQLRESIEDLDKRVGQLDRERKGRWTVAVVLKVLSVVSGLVIAIGFYDKSFTQVLGGLISGIAAVERVFANMSRLLAVAAAKQAYERIRRSVEKRHNRQIVEVVKYRKRKKLDSAELLIRFSGELRDDLAIAKDEIEEGLAKNDYENIGRLSLDEQVEMPVATP